MNETVRPTKKQRELLGFIESFIAEHGYSPSYREIMHGLQYSSVATVALHVQNLTARGHLQKRDHSARSLEVVRKTMPEKIESNLVTASQEKWLVEQIDYRFKQLETSKITEESALDGLYILVGTLRVLGFEGAAQSFIARLGDLKKASNL